MVQSVQFNALYHPVLSESHKIINADAAWAAAGGRSTAGAGIKIGDIDSGIDETHPFFDPTGFSYPPGFPKCDAADSATHKVDQSCEHVSRKVIVAKVFYKANQQGLDAQAIDDHGTHTAGIAAGVTGKVATVEGVAINDMSGVAPGAWLGNYNVFPSDIANARSEGIRTLSMRRLRTAWTFLTYRSAEDTAVTTTCLRSASTMQLKRVW